MKIYILDQRKDNTKHNAVGKAMTDVFSVMGECRVKTVPGVPKDANKALKALDLVVLALYCIFVFGSKDYCIFVYKDNTAKIKILKDLKFIRRYKTVCFINDVNSIRGGGLYSENNRVEMDKEFAHIGSADIIMAPNEGSKKYMQERGMTNKIVTVGVWDYLMDDDMGGKCDELTLPAATVNEAFGDSDSSVKWKVGFAGNLGKSDFLKEIDKVTSDNVEYHLWGDANGVSFGGGRLVYEGSVSPNVLPLEIAEKCNFGLVWDGKSATHIEGGYGEYLRFNNSHKCGCYLASGIPVIVWSGSGASYLVNETGCGIVIDGLQDISAKLGNMTQEEYAVMLEATKVVAAKVRSGYYIKAALEEVTGCRFIED